MEASGKRVWCEMGLQRERDARPRRALWARAHSLSHSGKERKLLGKDSSCEQNYILERSFSLIWAKWYRREQERRQEST